LGTIAFFVVLFFIFLATNSFTLWVQNLPILWSLLAIIGFIVGFAWANVYFMLRTHTELNKEEKELANIIAYIWDNMAALAASSCSLVLTTKVYP
jgi:hypothetical protein